MITHISGLKLIELLESNNFTIELKDNYYKVTDKIRNVYATSSIDEAKLFLSESSFIYNKYSKVPEEELQRVKNIPSMFDDLEKTYKHITDSLIKYYCLRKCTKTLSRFDKILKNYIKTLNTVDS
jgi:hypothetical protein